MASVLFSFEGIELVFVGLVWLVVMVVALVKIVTKRD